MKSEIKDFEAKYMKKTLPEFSIGDMVDVHFLIKEEGKMRSQVFSGVVISKKGISIGKTFTVRRVSYGEGVERVFPLHSPLLENVVVQKRGKVRRAKLHYLRGKTGKKATKVEEKLGEKKPEPKE